MGKNTKANARNENGASLPSYSLFRYKIKYLHQYSTIFINFSKKTICASYSRMKTIWIAVETLCIHSSLQFFGEKNVGYLRANVPHSWFVAIGKVEVIQRYGNSFIKWGLKASVGKGTYVNNPWLFGFSYQWPELMSQIKMAEMIDCHMHFKVLPGKGALGQQEDSRIIDEDVDLLNLSLHSFSQLVDCFDIS